MIVTYCLVAAAPADRVVGRPQRVLLHLDGDGRRASRRPHRRRSQGSRGGRPGLVTFAFSRRHMNAIADMYMLINDK